MTFCEFCLGYFSPGVGGTDMPDKIVRDGFAAGCGVLGAGEEPEVFDAAVGPVVVDVVNFQVSGSARMP